MAPKPRKSFSSDLTVIDHVSSWGRSPVCPFDLVDVASRYPSVLHSEMLCIKVRNQALVQRPAAQSYVAVEQVLYVGQLACNGRVGVVAFRVCVSCFPD